MQSLGRMVRAGGRKDWADVRVALAKKEGAAGGDGKK